MIQPIAQLQSIIGAANRKKRPLYRLNTKAHLGHNYYNDSLEIVEALKEHPQTVNVGGDTEMGDYHAPTLYKEAANLIEGAAAIVETMVTELNDLRVLVESTDNRLVDFNVELLHSIKRHIMDDTSIPIESRTALNFWISEINVSNEYIQYLLKK